MTEPRTRRAWAVVVVGLVTLGIGFFVYYFRAFRELDARAGRRHSGLLFLGLVPLVGPFVAHAYMRKELDGLAQDRFAAGLGPTMTARRHLWLVLVGLLPALASLSVMWPMGDGWFLVSFALATWSPAFAVPYLVDDINGYWERLRSGAQSRPPSAAGL